VDASEGEWGVGPIAKVRICETLSGVTLRSRDLQAVLSFVADAHDADGPEALDRELLDRLVELFGCEYVTYQTFDWQRRVVTAYVSCSNEGDVVDVPSYPESFWTASNPPHWTGGAFRKLSDTCTRRERERIRDEWACNASFPTIDWIGFRVGDRRTRSAWLCLDSHDRDLDERERELALALRPHVHALWRRSNARKQADELTAALERDAAAIVVLTIGKHIEHATAEARRLLLDWFGTRNGRLPHSLAEWLAVASPADVYTAGRNGSLLTVQLNGDHTLTLRERASDPVRLTPREREVLGLVASGLTNAEIARTLWVSPSTVAKHLEQAYAKLGVHNRTAAVARLAELPG
jgi:DNA-binding CsgD family transcriptional regulator